MSRSAWTDRWEPDDEAFWASTGRRIARRNLTFSVFAESLGYSVWLLWSVVATRLNDAGFDLSSSQLFTPQPGLGSRRRRPVERGPRVATPDPREALGARREGAGAIYG